jgi:hypothetical protein
VDVFLATRYVGQLRKVAEVYSIDRRRVISPRQYRYEDGRYRLHPGTNKRHANVARLIRLNRRLLADQILSDAQNACGFGDENALAPAQRAVVRR